MEEIKVNASEKTPVQTPQQKADDYLTYALIAVVVGFCTGLGLIGGIVGLIFTNKCKENGGDDSSLYQLAQIGSVVDIIVGIFGFLLLAIWMIVAWGLVFYG